MLKNLAPATVLLIGALSLMTGWLLGTSGSPLQNQPGGASAGPRSGPRPLGSPAVAPFTRQLRERLDAQPARTPAAGRNPFVFEARRPAAGVRRHEAPEVAALPPSAPMGSEPPAPQVKLSGIATSQEGEVKILTAIVNDHGALAFVKTGDQLSNGYRVVQVDDTGIVIVDAAGVTQTLRLP